MTKEEHGIRCKQCKNYYHAVEIGDRKEFRCFKCCPTPEVEEARHLKIERPCDTENFEDAIDCEDCKYWIKVPDDFIRFKPKPHCKNNKHIFVKDNLVSEEVYLCLCKCIKCGYSFWVHPKENSSKWEACYVG